jgi:TM2 domain-containing membrane protein YozV
VTRGTKQYDPNTVFLIELVGGFFGLLGLGHLYLGRTNDGILRLVLWLLYDIIAGVTIALLSTVVVGLVCIPFQLA